MKLLDINCFKKSSILDMFDRVLNKLLHVRIIVKVLQKTEKPDSDEVIPRRHLWTIHLVHTQSFPKN